MRPKYLRVVSIPVRPVGNFRSLPTEIGSPVPGYPVLSPRPMEHPQEMTGTVDADVRPFEPTNDSSLVIKIPRELLSDQPEQSATP